MAADGTVTWTDYNDAITLSGGMVEDKDVAILAGDTTSRDVQAVQILLRQSTSAS